MLFSGWILQVLRLEFLDSETHIPFPLRSDFRAQDVLDLRWIIPKLILIALVLFSEVREHSSSKISPHAPEQFPNPIPEESILIFLKQFHQHWLQYWFRMLFGVFINNISAIYLRYWNGLRFEIKCIYIESHSFTWMGPVYQEAISKEYAYKVSLSNSWWKINWMNL